MAFSLSTGCILRSTEDYKTDTQKLLDSREGRIQECYDAVRSSDPNAAGDVVVHFMVDKKTGDFSAVEVVAEKTTAPGPVAECVTSNIGDLVLVEGDMANGDGTFTWRFSG
jgi:hypothetical protein